MDDESGKPGVGSSGGSAKGPRHGVKRARDEDRVPHSEHAGLQARFLQSTKDLRFVGVIKPVPRREECFDRTVFNLDAWQNH